MLDEQTRRAIQDIFAKQGERRWELAGSLPGERKARLRKLKTAIIEHTDEIASAIHADFRKPAFEVELTEIHPVLDEINHTLRHLSNWMDPKTVPTPLTFGHVRSEIHYQARGRVLILSPWNYPFNLLISPLIAAVAAGNCVILKPSDKVPHTAQTLRRLIAEVFPPHEVALFEGGADLGDFLITLPFDHIFFTGSPPIGKKIMAAAAEHFATVTLELGGKSPAILAEDADLKTAAQRIMWGKFVNAGQTCVAPDYVLLPQKRLKEFLVQAKQALEELYGVSAQRRKNPDFCRLINLAAFKRLQSVLENAIGQGAVLEEGGETSQEECYIAPTILSHVTYSSPIMQEEIFGPILPILTYERYEDVLAPLRQQPKPLAIYIFAKHNRDRDYFIQNTTSGGAVLNNVLLHVANPELPFGGVGMSGQGNYHGFAGFRTFSHERSVLRQGLGNLPSFFYPPYRGKLKSLMQSLLRFLDRL